MTKEQDKATELINKYYDELGKINGIYIGITKQSKQCALIAVDEIINSYEGNIRELNIDVIHNNPIQFWQEVKEEIKKL